MISDHTGMKEIRIGSDEEGEIYETVYENGSATFFIDPNGYLLWNEEIVSENVVNTWDLLFTKNPAGERNDAAGSTPPLYSEDWPSMYQHASYLVNPPDFHPTVEDVQQIAWIAVRLFLPEPKDLILGCMGYDAKERVWTVHYFSVNKQGNLMVGGGVNVAIDEATLQILLVWPDE